MDTYQNFKGMPDDLREKVKGTLAVLFSDPHRGSWREVADTINGVHDFGPGWLHDIHLNFDSEFVRDVYRRMNKRDKPKPEENKIHTPDDVPARDFERENADLRSTNRNLFTQLTKARDWHAAFIEAAHSAARDAVISLGPIGPTPAPDLNPHSTVHTPEVALWHMTDWQGAKRTVSYNSEVMVERVMRFARKAVKITNIQRADHPVTRCVICFGGDMVEGLFQFPRQVFEVDATIFDQYVRVSRLLVEVVQFALNSYDEVEVISEWGNHGRIGSKRDNVPGYDNFDRMCYYFAKSLLGNEPRLTWEDSAEDIRYFEIGNYASLLIHGDEVGRNGFASPMTIVRHADRWRSGAYGKVFRDLYVGHYHNHNEWSMANGQGTVYQTGSTESDNRYARDTMAASAIPSQRLHFIDEDRGRVTAQYKIFVDED